MRLSCAVLVCFVTGCATTVWRLDGEVPTSAGPARSTCEKQDWLVLAPTRSEIAEEGQRTTHARDDGIAIYHVGEGSPESIPSLSARLGGGPLFERHARAVSDHDDRRILAAALGGAGIVALGIGAALFVSSFESRTVATPGGGMDEEQSVNSGRAAASGIVVALGFGLGIAGILVNPGGTERARAAAARYVFLPPADDLDDVGERVARHNEGVRARCTDQPATLAR